MWTLAGCRLMLELALAAAGDEAEIDEWWLLLLGCVELEPAGLVN